MKSTNRLGILLKQELETKKNSNPDYSLRKLGKDLGMNSGILSSIIAGKRKVSYDLAEKVCLKLGMPAAEIMVLLAEPDISQKVSIKKAAKEHYEILDRIEYSTLYALIKTADFKTDVRWIAERLEVSEEETVEMIRKFVRLGILRFNENSQLIRNDDMNLLHLADKSEALDRLMLAMINNSIEYFKNRDDFKSEFPVMTMSVNSSRITEFKKRNFRFLMECFEFLQQGELDQVYAFAQQFFPLTKKDKKNS